MTEPTRLSHRRKLTLWQRIVLFYVFVRSQDPARLQAFWKALLGVALGAGVTVPEWLDARVSAVIVALWVVLTFWQGESTRARVVPVDNVPATYYASTLAASHRDT